MDKEIKRLLKLSSIPNFRLSKKEQWLLDAWKAQQKPIKVTKRKDKNTKLKTVENVIRKTELTLNQES